MAILIHHNHSGYQLPENQPLIQLGHVIIEKEKAQTGDINIIFTNNEEILELNREYLEHDYYTDVIAFHYGPTTHVEGDIFISLDKVYENSLEYQTGFKNELVRVVIHGLLHLTGYNDKTDEERQHMRHLEDEYLDYYHHTLG